MRGPLASRPLRHSGGGGASRIASLHGDFDDDLGSISFRKGCMCWSDFRSGAVEAEFVAAQRNDGGCGELAVHTAAVEREQRRNSTATMTTNAPPQVASVPLPAVNTQLRTTAPVHPAMMMRDSLASLAVAVHATDLPSFPMYRRSPSANTAQ